MHQRYCTITLVAWLLFIGIVWANEPSAKNSDATPTVGAETNSHRPLQNAENTSDSLDAAAKHRTTGSTSIKSDEKSHKPPLSIDKQTTYILTPIRPDGYPDYFAALNDHCCGPASSGSNAAVLLIQAFGPAIVPAEISEDYFKLLGEKPLRPVGHYFVRSQEMVERWIKGDPQLQEGDQEDSLQGQFTAAGAQPWSPAECPLVAEWLSLNEDPLRLIIEASRRTNFYEPIVAASQNLPALYSVVLPLEQSLNEITLALQARAMLRVKTGQIDAAWSDLLACHRCLRLMATMPLGQYALETRTAEIVLCQTELRLLHCCRPSVKQIKQMQADLMALRSAPSVADRIDIGDRFRFLDTICLIRRQGSTALQQLLGEPLVAADDSAIQKSISDSLFDWNEPLRVGNQWFDKQATIYRITDRKMRDEAAEQARVGLEQMANDAVDTRTFAFPWFTKSLSKAKGRIVGGTLLQFFESDCPAIINADDQLKLHLAFTQSGVALVAYRAEHGEYPERLDELVPKYIAKLPRDLYGDHIPLHYRRESNGYLLYSVGPNGRDEQGGESDNFPDSDDISISISDPPGASTQK